MTNYELKQALDKGDYVNVPKIISYLKTRMYMGRGVEFKSDDKEILKKWKKFNENNDFYSFMFQQERKKSEIGATFITIDKLQNGDIVVNDFSPVCGASGVAYSFANAVCAVCIQELKIDNSIVYCRSTYDTEKVVRQFWTLNAITGKGSLYDKTYQIDKKYQLELGTYDEATNSFVYYHNLGFVPVVCMYNNAFRPRYPLLTAGLYYQSPFTSENYQNATDYNYEQVKDTANCSKLLLQLDNLYIHMNKLIELYKPVKTIITNDPTEVRGNRKFNQKFNQLKNDNDATDADVIYSNASNQTKIEYGNTPNNIDSYQNQIVATWIDIFKSCGLSYLTQSGTQKTAQESYNAFKGDLEEVNKLRAEHTNQWKQLIFKCFKAMGIELKDEKWSLQVKKNVSTDEASLLANLIQQYQTKMKTPVEMLAIIEGIDEKDAELIYEKNLKWFDKHKEQTDFPGIVPPENSNVSGVKTASLPTTKAQGGAPTKTGEKVNDK